MRAEVMSGKAQTNNQAFIAEDLLFVSENGVSELRVEGRESFRFRVAGLHHRDLKRIIGVARPCNPFMSAIMSGSVEIESPYIHPQAPS